MKKLIFIVLLLFTFCNVYAKESRYPSEVINTLEVFINCLNNSDEDVYSVVDPNNEKLINDIKNQIDDIYVSYNIISIKTKGENYYRVKIEFDASGEKWSTNGFSSWFDIKMINGEFKVSDTNLFSRVGYKYISTVGNLCFALVGFIIFFPFIALFLTFIKGKKRNPDTKYLSNQNIPL